MEHTDFAAGKKVYISPPKHPSIMTTVTMRVALKDISMVRATKMQRTKRIK